MIITFWAHTEDDIGVVKFVVLCDPSSNKSPGGLDSGVSSKSGDLLRLTAELRLGPEVSGGKLCGKGSVGLLYKV